MEATEEGERLSQVDVSYLQVSLECRIHTEYLLHPPGDKKEQTLQYRVSLRTAAGGAKGKVLKYGTH